MTAGQRVVTTETHLHNAPPSHSQTLAVAIIGIAVILFAAAFLIVLAWRLAADAEHHDPNTVDLEDA